MKNITLSISLLLLMSCTTHPSSTVSHAILPDVEIAAHTGSYFCMLGPEEEITRSGSLSLKACSSQWFEINTQVSRMKSISELLVGDQLTRF